MFKNTGSQVVSAQLVSKTDGSNVTSGTTTVYVTIDGGTQATGSVGSGAATHEGQGTWSYTPSQAETNGDQITYTFVNTTAVSACIQVYTWATISRTVNIAMIGGEDAETYFPSLVADALTSYGVQAYTRVVHTGNDTTSGTNLKNAIETASDGEVVWFSAGKFEIGTGITVPANVTVIGEGMNASEIFSDDAIQNVTLGANCTLRDLKINNTHPSAGLALMTADGGYCQNVWMSSPADAVAPSDTGYVLLDNCHFYSEFDTLTNSLASTWHLRNCYVFTDGAIAGTGQLIALLNPGATIIAEDTSFASTGASIAALAFMSSDCTIRLHRCSIYINRSASLASILAQFDDTGNVLRLIDCEYDRSLANTGSGTFTDVYSPLRPTTVNRTLDVSATGEADANVTQFGGTNGTFTSGRPAVQSVAANVGISAGTVADIASEVNTELADEFAITNALITTVDTVVDTINGKLNSNFTTFVSANAGNRTITDLTTPKNQTLSFDD